MIEVEPGTVVVFSDIGCPWAHLAVFRLHRARAELGLEREITFDHRAFPLELFNERPTPKKTLDAEFAVVGALDPDAGWQMWQRPEFEYPVTTLLALEAVQAAKRQSLRAGEELDRALRIAFFGESRTISMRHVILDVARGCPSLDTTALADDLDHGSSRIDVMEQQRVAETEDVQGSPHVFLPDGTNEPNPGIAMEWEGSHGVGFPVVHEDRPKVYIDLLQRAADHDEAGR
ncbi:MAG TPA: DsbA family protein [Actinomycetota bacterium]|nr:DsbA family protein [Actinomycetota bacterium]